MAKHGFPENVSEQQAGAFWNTLEIDGDPTSSGTAKTNP
jgi:hypothetical protein